MSASPSLVEPAGTPLGVRLIASPEKCPLLDAAHYVVIGNRTLDALNAPEPVSPLPGFLDPDPVLHALTAEAKVGKTTFAAQLGIAFAAGVAPWPGAPSLERSGVLFISAEESVGRVARLHYALARSLGVEPEKWLGNVGFVARGRLQPTDGLCILQLHVKPESVAANPSRVGGGFDVLQRILTDARTADGLPFRYVVIDSASRVWDVSDEADNAAVSRWMNELQRICIEAGARILVIHHQGHNRRERASVAGRGASAFGAVARVNMALSFGGCDTSRELTVEGNAIAPVAHRMRITRPIGGILGVYSRALSLAEEVEHAMPLNEAVSVNALAERVLRFRGSAARSSGQLRERVGNLLDAAVDAGTVARTGNKNAGYQRLGSLCGLAIDRDERSEVDPEACEAPPEVAWASSISNAQQVM